MPKRPQMQPSVPTMKPLTDGWLLTGSEQLSVPAIVPGSVHTDLLAAGVIPDPYLDDNEAQLTWSDRAPWTYQTQLDWHPDGGDRVDLVCEGLDPVTTVSVNG
jgi:beta-mannosidase